MRDAATVAQWLEQVRRLCPAVDGIWDKLELNAVRWVQPVSSSPFWRQVQERLRRWEHEYERESGGTALLAASGVLPQFHTKKSSSIRSKAYRRRCDPDGDLDIGVWPRTGAIIPRLNDYVRTRFEVRFLDGIDFLATRLQSLAVELGVKHRLKSMVVDHGGYFARHFYFGCAVEYEDGGRRDETAIECEVQLGTVLATHVWAVSHATYEAVRSDDDVEDDHWTSDLKDARFLRKQIGHMLHLADALLLQLRDANRGPRYALGEATTRIEGSISADSPSITFDVTGAENVPDDR